MPAIWQPYSIIRRYGRYSSIDVRRTEGIITSASSKREPRGRRLGRPWHVSWREDFAPLDCLAVFFISVPPAELLPESELEQELKRTFRHFQPGNCPFCVLGCVPGRRKRA
jgi:hypothetical protein